MGERVSFNVNAELYENRFGELAIRFPGERVYQEVGTRKGENFLSDALRMLEQGECPKVWREMAPHELLYGKDWHCISRMGYVSGDERKPALEMEAQPKEIGARARAYLQDVLH
ncbi:MAG: hypothetical protein C0617_07275 [Desulfuromonas sp.]|mgnify:CR=1 FL=1|uniref:hypothetical protein n=1 Tax=Desulfuromonas sp. TaxID=892 RepID=UPI000CB41E4F|nr:hypothetical protein [Desulfuromonas sp.]PLX84633.1 MAG: hypothetical protein C0617_07275 [Desulfuromonas sp.]